jgi:hypothetical protein
MQLTFQELVDVAKRPHSCLWSSSALRHQNSTQTIH